MRGGESRTDTERPRGRYTSYEERQAVIYLHLEQSIRVFLWVLGKDTPTTPTPLACPASSDVDVPPLNNSSAITHNNNN